MCKLMTLLTLTPFLLIHRVFSFLFQSHSQWWSSLRISGDDDVFFSKFMTAGSDSITHRYQKWTMQHRVIVFVLFSKVMIKFRDREAEENMYFYCTARAWLLFRGILYQPHLKQLNRYLSGQNIRGYFSLLARKTEHSRLVCCLIE